MKVLFLTPLASARELWGQYERGGGAYFPLGLLSVAGVALKAGHQVELLDVSTLRTTSEQLEQKLVGGDFDVIGLGNCYTSLAHLVFRTAEFCRKILPHAKLVVGGIHPTLFPNETLEVCPALDFAVFGEGELTFEELLKYLNNEGSELRQIQGLCYRSGQEVRCNEPRPPIKDISELPPLPYHLLDIDSYVPPPSNYKRLPTYGFLVQRGCPYRCAYCDARVHGRIVRHDNIDKIIGQMKYLIQNHGMKGIIFHDSCLTINRRFSVEFFSRMIDEKINVAWCCYTRVDKVDPELLSLMKKAGCWSVSFGLESGNQVSLERIHKGVTLAQNREGVRMAKKAGLQVVGSFILCLPGEDEQMSRNTIKFAKELNLDTAVFFLPVPFFGTEIYEMCKAEDALPEDIKWEDFKMWMDPTNPIYVNPLIGDKKMVKLYNEAVSSFYLSPKTLMRSLMQIHSVSDLRKYSKGFISIIEIIKRRFKQVQ